MQASTGDVLPFDDKNQCIDSTEPDSVQSDCPLTLGNLAIAMGQAGRYHEAIALQRRCVALTPQSAVAHHNLGISLKESGQALASLACFRQALQISSQYLDAWINLGIALSDLHQFDEALDAYGRALAIEPKAAFIWRLAGRILWQSGRDPHGALVMLEKAVELNPTDPDALITLGNVLLATGAAARSRDIFERALALRPLFAWPGKQKQPDFSVLVLDSPGAGCTPIEYLIADARFDTYFYCVLPGFDHDIDLLRGKADLVINIIADADSGADVLPDADSIAHRLGLPVINHSRHIATSDRASSFRRLAQLAHGCMPTTIRMRGVALIQAAQGEYIEGCDLPLIVRLAGCHGGDTMEKAVTWEQASAFAQAHLDEDVYVTSFVDYRSADGFYRKYRFICIDGELLPYHLAIHDDWMVHHFRTDMAQQAWKRNEELAFLAKPEHVFDKSAQEVLKAIAQSTGLDYCGIDCALDSEGRVVLFEVNAAMLVHDEKAEAFVYKNPYVARIRDAFVAMIVRRLSNTRPDQ